MVSYKPLSPTLWNAISFNVKICHFSIVYRNASYTTVPQRIVSSQKAKNKMSTNIPGQNKVRKMAFNLHKHYPSVMHLGQEMKSFTCKVEYRVVSEAPATAGNPASSAPRRIPLCFIILLFSWVQLGFHLSTTFFNLFIFHIHSCL